MNYENGCTANEPRGCTDAPRPCNPVPPNRAKEVLIRQADHGFIVVIGCQTFAVESADRMLSAIGKYLKNPADVEQKWLNKEFEL